jgi:hypothetical protein
LAARRHLPGDTCKVVNGALDLSAAAPILVHVNA